MLSFALSELSGELHGPDVRFVGLSTDSRAIQPGSLFVALRGERVDGHDFIAAARQAGAAGALVERVIADPLPQLVVSSCEIALGMIASRWRQQFSPTLIALTGSNGKTTVKNLLASILREMGPTLATDGNFNNEIGVPLTLAKLNAEHRFAVIEMGAGKPGDIAYLAALARPSIALVNNASAAHLERLGTLASVAQTKGAIYDTVALKIALLNRDDAFAHDWAVRAGTAQLSWFGLESPEPGDVSARDITLGETTRFTLVTPLGDCAIEVPLEGLHNVRNALAASAAAMAAGASLEAIRLGLERAPKQAGRLIRSHSPRGYALIDDSYNANPASLKAAIDTLSVSRARLWLALGDMGELGSEARMLHAECGRYAQIHGVEKLFACGVQSQAAVAAFGPGARHFESLNALIEALDREIGAGVTLLVKGSRSAKMERVVLALKQREAESC